MAKKKLGHDPVKAARLIDAAMLRGEDLTPVVAHIEATMEGPSKPEPKAKSSK